MIKQFKIQNYRMFKNSTIDFDSVNSYVLIGANGCGKSTILRLIFAALEGYGDTFGTEIIKEKDFPYAYIPDIDDTVYHQSNCELPKITPTDLIEIAKKHKLDIFGSSNGLNRLQLILGTALQLGKNGVLLIDEPERHLQIETQRDLLPILQNILSEGQIICATHSPCLVSSIDWHKQAIDIEKINEA